MAVTQQQNYGRARKPNSQTVSDVMYNPRARGLPRLLPLEQNLHHLDFSLEVCPVRLEVVSIERNVNTPYRRHALRASFTKTVLPFTQDEPAERVSCLPSG